MNIQPIGKNKILVELSNSDMKELDITYNQLDYSKIETRRVIWTILQRIRDTTGKDVDPTGNLLIEAVADSEGGCVLCFTVKEKRNSSQQLHLSKVTDSVIYEFQNENALLDSIFAIQKSCHSFGKIYKHKSSFRLILDIQPCCDERKILDEYGKILSKNDLTEAFTKEHWLYVGEI